MLRRLVIICHEDEKIMAHTLLSSINNPVEMCVIKDIKNQQEFERIISSFSGPKDIHICLMTDQSSAWIQQMLFITEGIIRKRALAVFAVLMGRFNISYDFFSSQPIISSTGDIKELSGKVTEIINNYLRIDFGRIKPWSLENLVKDVLKAYHFEGITLTYSDHVDFGYDMMCTYTRNDDMLTKENWLIEVKYAAEDRLTIRYIDSLIKQNRDHYPADSKVMLVTNGTLTTAIWTYIEGLQDKQNISILIVDGRKLCGLIAFHSNLINEYFPYE